MCRRLGLAVLIVAFVVGARAVSWLLVERIKIVPMAERCEAAMRANLPALRADQELLKRYGLDSVSPRIRDAGPVLNAKLSWVTTMDGQDQSWSTASPVISEELRKEIENLGSDWVLKRDAFVHEVPDLSWLAALNSYDHWNVYDDARARRLRQLPTFGLAMWYEHPFPKVVDLLLLEKLRLVEALRLGEVSSAVDESRHLGNLAISTHSMLGAVLGFRLLENAERAEAAAGDGPLLAKYSLQRRQEMTDALFRLAAYFNPLASSADLEEAFLSDPTPAGLCIALHEGFVAPALVRLPLTSGGPTRARFEARYRVLDRIVETHADECGLGIVLALWQNPPSVDALNEINRKAGAQAFEASSPTSRGAAMIILAKGFQRADPICAP